MTADTASLARYLGAHPAFSDLPPATFRDIAEAALRDAEEIREALRNFAEAGLQDTEEGLWGSSARP
jgi:hypothetical protein